MIALKIIGRAPCSARSTCRIGQSNASTLTPVCMAVSPVWSGSGEHAPDEPVLPPLPLLELVLPVLLLEDEALPDNPDDNPLLVFAVVPLPCPPVPPLPFSPPPQPYSARARAPSAAVARTMLLPWMVIPRG